MAKSVNELDFRDQSKKLDGGCRDVLDDMN